MEIWQKAQEHLCCLNQNLKQVSKAVRLLNTLLPPNAHPEYLNTQPILTLCHCISTFSKAASDHCIFCLASMVIAPTLHSSLQSIVAKAFSQNTVVLSSLIYSIHVFSLYYVFIFIVLPL